MGIDGCAFLAAEASASSCFLVARDTKTKESTSMHEIREGWLVRHVRLEHRVAREIVPGQCAHVKYAPVDVRCDADACCLHLLRFHASQGGQAAAAAAAAAAKSAGEP